MSFVFYDTETTGTHTSFDQILQFAAIKTDAELNEIERFEIRCQIHPHVVPSIGALRVTNIHVDQITDQDLPTHYEMVCRILAKMADWSPAIFVGWNTMDFDEHLLRQALFQCLHKPYLTNTNGNCRADIMKIAQVAVAMEPGAIQVPMDGTKAIFKLDQVAPLNGFAHVNAHDALSDVEATIHMAKLLLEDAPDTWSNAIRFSKKASVVDFIQEDSAFLLCETYFGRPYRYVVTRIGEDPQNPAAALTLSLSSDVDYLRTLPVRRLATALSGSPKPIRKVRTNACPNIRPLPDEGWNGEPVDDLIERAQTIQADEAFVARLLEAYALTQTTYEVSEHVEEQIYGGFSSDEDNLLMAEFHDAPWRRRFEVVEKFEDKRLIKLGRRLIYIHSPQSLPPEILEEEATEVARRLTGYQFQSTPWLTIGKAQNEAFDTLNSYTAFTEPRPAFRVPPCASSRFNCS